jgi:quinoprotein glucose dehydrogenase
LTHDLKGGAATGARRSLFARPYVFALLLVLIGVVLAAGGVRLLLLGGSPYYVAAGLLTIASGVLTAMGRRLGAILFGVLLVVSLAWAIGEVGFSWWQLVARLVAPAVLGLWFLAPWTARRLEPRPVSTPARRAGIGLAAAAIATVIGALSHTLFVDARVDPLYQAGVQAAAAPPAIAPSDDGRDWRAWGGDAGGTRFSPLAQLNPANVGGLEVAWTFHFGPTPKGAPTSLEATPLKIGETLYACSDYNDVVALDAETGRQRWRFRANVDATNATYGHCRGVAYFRVPGASGACSERIYTNTIDARLIALDLATGRPCQGFGRGGYVDLKEGMSTAPKGYYFVTSAPTVARGRIVLGGWVLDGMYWGEPSGVIRAFDAVTGRLSWAFDVGRPDRTGAPGPGETYTPSTPNAWAPMSVDEQRGLVFAPLGGAAPDYAGAQRRPFDNAWSGTVVAINAETGRPRWRFQTVHHDIWDYDVASQPTLIDLPTAGGMRPALIQATKRGEVFVLDRETGRPLRPVTNRRAPQAGTVPGERAAPFQPFSDSLPSFRGATITERDMWGTTPLDQLWCRIKFREARYQGTLTAPGFTPSIAQPGFLGGMNWGGVSIDRDRMLMIVNNNAVANYVQLFPRAIVDQLGVRPVGMGAPPKPEGQGIQPQLGTPFGVRSIAFLSPLYAPCQAPPWGRLSAVDLRSGKLVWSHALGTARDSGPLGIGSQLPFTIGTPNLGGSIVTRGGLIFIAATQDKYLRAIETATGREVWRGRLEQAGQATPMTYASRASGRQFVVVSAGGHAFLGTRTGDAIMAFALPRRTH